jgi:hypothetical protein
VNLEALAGNPSPVNIFILDLDIHRCASDHCDQHVNKMILESVQLRCIALNKNTFISMKNPALRPEKSDQHQTSLQTLRKTLTAVLKQI